MTPIIRKLALATAIAFILPSGSTMAHEHAVPKMIDVRQETQISTTYELSPYLRRYDIEVHVHGGVATLTGQVDEEVNRELAYEIALGVKGIDSVNNRITIDAATDASGEGEARSYGDVIDDATVTASVKSKLLWSRFSEGLSTGVKTMNGNVQLTGTAETEEARAFAERLALNTHGVVSVENKMVVVPSTSTTEATAQTGTAISDTWITTKVKSTFMYSSNVSSRDISVSTDQGIVTLTGKVASGAEQALALELAQNIRGVKSVESSGLVF